jgi:hypothetical protein
LSEWLALIRVRGLPGVLEKLADRSEDSFRMRQSSPFAVVMPQEERLRILRRYEARRPRTHPAGVKASPVRRSSSLLAASASLARFPMRRALFVSPWKRTCIRGITLNSPK